MDRLEVVLRTVTPLFMGGAEPNEAAELRPPSIKGALRFWYRSLDRDYQANEPKWFGSSDFGQSPCTIRVVEPVVGKLSWDSRRYQLPPGSGGFQERGYINGIAYLGYSLNLGDNARKAIASGTDIRLSIVTQPGIRDVTSLHRVWLASLWLLGSLGGLGSRCRRGLGTVSLISWGGWGETSFLPLLCDTKSASDWLNTLQKGLRTLKEWFSGRPESNHAVLDDKTRILVLKKGWESWEKALNEAGRLFQIFRREKGKADYAILTEYPGKPLIRAPERTIFGLPLAFRYGSSQGVRTVSFVGSEHERSASPLWIRVVKIGGYYHPLFFCLNCPFLGKNEQLKYAADCPPLRKPSSRIVDEFLDKVVKPVALDEVRPW